jgi:hypothetical protein
MKQLLALLLLVSVVAMAMPAAQPGPVVPLQPWVWPFILMGPRVMAPFGLAPMVRSLVWPIFVRVNPPVKAERVALPRVELRPVTAIAW